MNQCPRCAATGQLTLTPVLSAKPAGSFTLAGAQDKTTATVAAYLSCAGCGWHATGHVHGPQVAADGTITGGHLIIDQPPPVEPSTPPAAGPDPAGKQPKRSG